MRDAVVFGLHVERRFEPFFRPAVDTVLREPLANLIQYLISRQRHDEGLGLAEERPLPGEEAALQTIIDTIAEYMRRHWQPGNYQRAGNTKTHGVVRATVTIRDDLPKHMRRGVFAEPRGHPAWDTVFRARTRLAARYRRRRVRQHGHQDDGRAGPQAAGR
jgi:hypothetical protein